MKFIRVDDSIVNLELVSYIAPEEEGKKTKIFFTAGSGDFALVNESFNSVLNKIMLMGACF